jgi:hypothetical protein
MPPSAIVRNGIARLRCELDAAYPNCTKALTHGSGEQASKEFQTKRWWLQWRVENLANDAHRSGRGNVLELPLLLPGRRRLRRADRFFASLESGGI